MTSADPRPGRLSEPVELLVNWDTAPFATGAVPIGPVEVVVVDRSAGSGRRLDLTVRNPGRHPVTLSYVAVRMQAWPDRVLEHGHQGSSVVRRCRPDDARPQRADLPAWVKSRHLSDPDAAGASVAGDQFLLTIDGLVGFLDGAHHLGTVTASPLGVTATALLDDVVLRPGQERALDPLWLAEGPPGPLYSEFASRWGDEAGARVTAVAPLGWSSWHQYGRAVTPADIRANLALAARHGFDQIEIGDGYQSATGDWLAGRDDWVDGTVKLAAEIRGAGLSAGIWTAPFLAGEASSVLARHPEWALVEVSPASLTARHPDAPGTGAVPLDTTRPDVLDHLRETYATLSEQGFDHHRVDYCYAAAVPGRRHDPDLTRGQALRAGLQAVRDGIGGDAFLVGAGCPFGPAVGLVDAMAVAPPVAGRWAPGRHWPGLAEAAPAVVNAVRATVLRSPLHRRVFVNDPGSLLLRPVGTDLEAAQRSFLAAVITGAGAFTTVSDDLALYTDAEWTLLESMKGVLAGVDTLLELDDPFADPLVVRSRAGTVLTVDWRGRGPDGPTAQLGVG